jgi:hypothetical protein
MSLRRPNIVGLGVSCYGGAPTQAAQLTLFDPLADQLRKFSDTLDKMNDWYREFVVTPAIMMGMDKVIIDRIPFGHLRELEDLYAT